MNDKRQSDEKEMAKLMKELSDVNKKIVLAYTRGVSDIAKSNDKTA